MNFAVTSGACTVYAVPVAMAGITPKNVVGGIGQVQFTAVTTGAIDDSDYVDIPEVGRDTVYLVTRARVTATDNSSVTVRVAVADPYPQGANSAAISAAVCGWRRRRSLQNRCSTSSP